MHATWLGLWAAGFLTRTQRLRLVAQCANAGGIDALETSIRESTHRRYADQGDVTSQTGRVHDVESHDADPHGVDPHDLDPDEAVRRLWNDTRRRPRKWAKFDTAQDLLNHAHRAHERLQRALENTSQRLRVVETSTLGVNARSPYLCYAGNLPPAYGALGIVGTRAIGQDEADKIKKWIYPLVSQSEAIISGGAHGVDTIAHRVAIEQNVPTWVVFASGLNHVSPRSNLALFEQCLAAGGGWISEKPPWYTPYANDFLERNTVIAGLSSAVLVARAPVRSGALSTARAAQAQGKPILAFPGNPDDTNAEGCHHLLQRGAHWADLQTSLASLLNAEGQLSVLVDSRSTQTDRTTVWQRPKWTPEEEALLRAFATWKKQPDRGWMFGCATQHQEAVLDLELGGWVERDPAGEIRWSERGALVEKLLQTEAKEDISC